MWFWSEIPPFRNNRRTCIHRSIKCECPLYDAAPHPHQLLMAFGAALLRLAAAAGVLPLGMRMVQCLRPRRQRSLQASCHAMNWSRCLPSGRRKHNSHSNHNSNNSNNSNSSSYNNSSYSNSRA